MSAIVILIVISLIVAVGFLAAFLWAVSDGQYDDSFTPSMRMLLENDKKQHKEQEQIKPSK